ATIVTVIGLDVDATKCVGSLGSNFAVIELSPTASVLTDRLAVPLASAFVPSESTPSKNSTLPAAPAPVTVAVSVTAAPWACVVGLDVTVVLVATGPEGTEPLLVHEEPSAE